MGVEMEGGKPGWYDALNGMPGMFGSSMAETYELARMLEYTIGALKRYPGELELIEEFSDFLQQLDLINASEKDAIGFCKKQSYRQHYKKQTPHKLNRFVRLLVITELFVAVARGGKGN